MSYSEHQKECASVYFTFSTTKSICLKRIKYAILKITALKKARGENNTNENTVRERVDQVCRLKLLFFYFFENVLLFTL